MEANINADELKLLAYLHEHAKGYGSQYVFDMERVAKELDESVEEIGKRWSYLAEHGLAGSLVGEYKDPFGGIYPTKRNFLTGAGENFMRALEAEPSIARKVTVSVVKEMGSVIQDVAVSILTGLIKGHMPE